MIKYVNALIITVKDTLKQPLVFIILILLALGGTSLVIFWKILKGKEETIRVERARNEVLTDELDKKNAFILDVLVGINVRANALFDSSEAEKKRQ